MVNNFCKLNFREEDVTLWRYIMELQYEIVQRTIGYNFKNTQLLKQAFTRRSYSYENGGFNNEVLEFIGDKALDLAVIYVMMEKFGKLSEDKFFVTSVGEGTFTEIKKQLVQKKALSSSMDKLGFNRFLLMGKGDIDQNIQNQDSVKEDLFEAIIGAVTVDSNYNFKTITDVVKNMIDFEEYFDTFDNDPKNYISKVQEFCQSYKYNNPDYEYDNLENIQKYHCRLTIVEIKAVYDGYGDSKSKARLDAATKCYNDVKNKGLLLNKYKQAIGDLSLDNSLERLNELNQKGLVKNPKFTFKQLFDSNGNSIWFATLKVDDNAHEFMSTSSSKKAVQRRCAYQLLEYLIVLSGNDEDEIIMFEDHLINLNQALKHNLKNLEALNNMNKKI